MKKIIVITFLTLIFLSSTALAAERNIFSPTTKKQVSRVTSKVKTPPQATSTVQSATATQAIIDLLNRKNSITYPANLSIDDVKKTETNQLNVGQNQVNWFDVALPWLLGLIVLLSAVIIIGLWNWQRQQTKDFYKITEDKEPLVKSSLPPVKKKVVLVETEVDKPIKNSTQAVRKVPAVKKQSLAPVGQVSISEIKKNQPAGLVDLKNQTGVKRRISKHL